MTAFVALLTPTIALADEFCTRDLNTLDLSAMTALLDGRGYVGRVSEPGTAQYICVDCGQLKQAIIHLGRPDPAREIALRSDAEALAKIQSDCAKKMGRCEVTAFDVQDAVGWTENYSFANTQVAQTYVLRGGDQLKIQIIDDTLEHSKTLAEKSARAIAHQLLTKGCPSK